MQLIGETLENPHLQQSLKSYFQTVGDALIKREANKQEEQVGSDLLLSASALQWLLDKAKSAAQDGNISSAELLKSLSTDIQTIAPSISDFISAHSDSLTISSLRAFVLSSAHVGTVRAELLRLFKPLSDS